MLWSIGALRKIPTVLEERTWDENDNTLVGWPLLDLLMWKAMTYGSMEWSMLAAEKGWQPKEGHGAALFRGLIYGMRFLSEVHFY